MHENLEEILHQFVAAKEAGDSAREGLREAMKTLNTAEQLFNRALDALADYIGSQNQSGSVIDIGGFRFNRLKMPGISGFHSIDDIFGDLF
jgi:hypothetical protein